METKITSIDKNVVEELNRNSFATDGAVFLGTGTAPTGKYKGFIVGDSGVTISAITYLYPEKYSGDATTFPWTSGASYPIEFSTLTTSAGNLILIKK